jgi:hypothetical protein
MLIKISPWDESHPLLAGTDLHFSMGGIEITEWKTNNHSVEGTLVTDWEYPVKLTALFPMGINKYEIRSVEIQPDQKKFWIELNSTRAK